MVPVFLAPEGGALPAFDVFDSIFPVRGKHRYGTATNRFGGGRGHGGQDVFARCGTRLAAARGGTVAFSGYHSRAGNYVVITGPEWISPLLRGCKANSGNVRF